jgi:hypothetical protein
MGERVEFRYKAILLHQTNASKPLALFAARSAEIDQWSGIPQKKRFGTGNDSSETAGFQREQNPARIKSLQEFYRDEHNVIQNPLLCATRELPDSKVSFVPHGAGEGQVVLGEVVVEVPDYGSLPLDEIFGRVRAYIEKRVPELKTRTISEEFLNKLKEQAVAGGHFTELDAEDLGDDSAENNEVEAEGAADDAGAAGEMDASSALFEESHIVDFWQEVAARHELLKQIGGAANIDIFLNFTRDALVSYLRPVVLVDGQHRLAGALKAAAARLNDDDLKKEIEARVVAGEAPAVIERDLIRREARVLPVSLLLSSDPEEQVFQFVVVNQKATPIGRALLGTIVSTSLSNEEMGKVADRLRNAGIQLEESQAITFMARSPQSPFCGLVERGMAGDAKDLLQWNVFASLIGIFRDLKGGKLFGGKNDYAAIWRDKYLKDSEIVKNYEDEGCKTPMEYWSRLDGPWRGVFMSFWTEIREKFGNSSDPDKHNFWGRTRESNLFNKISLTILAADFFEYLVSSKTTIDGVADVPNLVSEWLESVSDGYFDKDRNLGGVKKDSTGIRNQWAYVWSEYRKGGGSLPDRRLFRQPKAG